jgi:hypothetical protein
MDYSFILSILYKMLDSSYEIEYSNPLNVLPSIIEEKEKQQQEEELKEQKKQYSFDIFFKKPIYDSGKFDKSITIKFEIFQFFFFFFF